MNGGAGYKHFILQPSSGTGFTSLEGSYNSNYGEISSSWTADGLGIMTSYKATVPANTTATLYLPVRAGTSNFGVTKGVVFRKTTTRFNRLVAEYELESGTYGFNISSASIVVR